MNPANKQRIKDAGKAAVSRRSIPSWMGFVMMVAGFIMALPAHPIIPEWLVVIEGALKNLAGEFGPQIVFLGGVGVTFFGSITFFRGGK